MTLRVDHRSIPVAQPAKRRRATVLAVGFSIAVHATAFGAVMWHRGASVPAQVLIVSLAELDAAREQGEKNADAAPPDTETLEQTVSLADPVIDPAPIDLPVAPSNLQDSRPARQQPQKQSAAPSVQAAALNPSLSEGAQTQPRYNGQGLSNPPPSYPFSARRRGQEGEVILRVLVNELGAAVRVDLRRSSGYRNLDNAAAEAVAEWRFIPASSNSGEPMPAEVDVPIVFRLTGG